MDNRKIYEVTSHTWGSEWDELVAVSTATCADCGEIVSSAGWSGKKLFFLSEEEYESCYFEDRRWSKPSVSHLARLAREYGFRTIGVLYLTRGWDENGREQSYCYDCSKKVVDATCQRCGKQFNRTRDLIGGWACEHCFAIHCEAMCKIIPGMAPVVVSKLLEMTGDDSLMVPLEESIELYGSAMKVAEAARGGS